MEKILVLNFEYPPYGGGGGAATKNIVEALSRSEAFSIDVVTLGGKATIPFEKVNDRLSIWREGRARKRFEASSYIDHLLFLVKVLARSLALTRSSRHSLVHCHFILPTGLIGLILKKMRGIPYVISVHGSDILGYSKRFGFAYAALGSLWNMVLRNACAITIPHDHLMDSFDASLRSKISVVPHFAADTCNRASFEKGEERFILSSGRLIKEKGFETLIEAFSKIESRDWRVKIAGDGYDKERLSTLSRKLGISGKVDFLGWLNREEMSNIYGRASLFVAPSEKESFGLALLESIAAGTYSIARDIPSHAEIVALSRSGELFRDADELASILDKYVSRGSNIPTVDPSHMKAAFDPERIIGLYKRIYSLCRS